MSSKKGIKSNKGKVVSNSTTNKSNKFNIKINDSKDYLISFSISNIDVSVANAMRRILISEIPSMAIETVEILDNNTPLIDEYLVHRLGQIPLITNDIDSFNFKKDCSCIVRCENCSFEFSLDVQNTTDDIIDIFSSNLIPQNNINNKTVNPVQYSFHNEGILIAKIAPGQKIKFNAFCSKGTGSEHAKFSCVCPATYDFDENTNTYNFIVETNGVYKAKDVVLKAFTILNQKLDSIM